MGTNVCDLVAAESGTCAADWEMGDGPETGVGVEYWLFNDKENLQAYVCLDQGAVVACQINSQGDADE